jgi:hypothetical protein
MADVQNVENAVGENNALAFGTDFFGYCPKASRVKIMRWPPQEPIFERRSVESG